MTRDEALKKYSSCYVGQDPARFMTISDGKLVCRRLVAEDFEVGGLYANPVSQTKSVDMISTDDMIADGFPPDFPISLQIKGEKDWHHAEQTKRWLDSGLWAWGLKWCLRWGW